MVGREAIHIFCAVSGHGYGHLAQVSPVFHRLHERNPNIRLHVVVDLPKVIVREKLPMAETIDQRALDVGLVQKDPFFPDLHGTIDLLEALHGSWEETIEAEAERMRALRPDLVIGDIPYLTFAAAHRIGVPSIAVASLTWDEVLKAYFPIDSDPFNRWYHQMQEAYGYASLALHPAPALNESPFSNKLETEPIHQSARRRSEQMRERLGISDTDYRPVVLVTTGGITGEMPITRLQSMTDCHWLVVGADKIGIGNVHSTACLDGFRFFDIIASADVILAKAGYNTAVEAVAAGVPIVYVPRGQFPDEQPIINWMKQYGVARELPMDDFLAGRWTESVMAISGERLEASEFTGAEQAAEAISGFF